MELFYFAVEDDIDDVDDFDSPSANGHKGDKHTFVSNAPRQDDIGNCQLKRVQKLRIIWIFPIFNL